MAIPDNYVLRSLSDAPTVLVASRFDGDTIIPHIEVHVFNQYVGTRFRVAAIVIVVVAVYIYIAYGDIIAEYRMDDPEGRIVDLHIFHQYIFAAVELYHAGAQVMPFSKYTFVYRNGVDAHLTQTIHSRPLQCMPAIECYSSVSINRTFTGQGNVGTLICIDERGVVETFCSFPFGQYHGEIVGSYGGEFQACTFGYM